MLYCIGFMPPQLPVRVMSASEGAEGLRKGSFVGEITLFVPARRRIGVRTRYAEHILDASARHQTTFIAWLVIIAAWRHAAKNVNFAFVTTICTGTPQVMVHRLTLTI